MYDLQYVRKRRRRKIAAVVAFFSAIGVASLVTVSFLGRTTGTFTVAVTNSAVRLGLSKTNDFSKSTAVLHIDKLLPLRETSYVNLPSDDILDAEEQEEFKANVIYDEQGNPDSLQYIKYTFFISNLSNTIASYNLNINLGDRNKSNDGTERTLDDTLRVMVYQNDGDSNNHDRLIFAKEAAKNNVTIDNKDTRREFISSYPSGSNQEDADHKLVDYSFAPGQTIYTYKVNNFKKGDVKRYTLIIWLEGEDPQSNGDDEIPEGASLKLGVDINAYENAE